MDKVADALLTLQGEKGGNAEIDRPKLFGLAVLAIRGFGEFQVRRGIGKYGIDLHACLRRMSAYEKEEILADGVLCVIPNRMEYGISTLKLGTFSRWGGW